ncbi:hypothetical protein BDZ91DRAFT_468352 [Kalaharituber pfeilii]|nr:hypothetical protein BDZ91DRAFT_468352 [Kalaharituber pfeilii]
MLRAVQYIVHVNSLDPFLYFASFILSHRIRPKIRNAISLPRDWSCSHGTVTYALHYPSRTRFYIIVQSVRCHRYTQVGVNFVGVVTYTAAVCESTGTRNMYMTSGCGILLKHYEPQWNIIFKSRTNLPAGGQIPSTNFIT